MDGVHGAIGDIGSGSPFARTVTGATQAAGKIPGIASGGEDSSAYNAWHNQLTISQSLLLRQADAPVIVSNAVRRGDPVRVAVGDFTLATTDVEYPWFGTSIAAKRAYFSSNQRMGSFGKGWVFNYDTRIIRGATFGAQEDFDRLNDEISQAQAAYDSARAEYNSASDGVATTISTLSERTTNLQQTIDALTTAYDQAVHPEIRDAISEILQEARTAFQDLQEFLAGAQGAQSSLQSSYSSITHLGTFIDNLRIESVEKQKTAEMSGAQTARNRYVVRQGDAQSIQYVGNDGLTLLDEAGTPHRYTLVLAPDYESPVRYPDGTRNYYPHGSRATASYPTDDSLELLPDGSFRLGLKDGTLKEFDYYGLLQHIVDRNGNIISFERTPETMHLARIRDGFNRALTFTTADGLITAITDPIGRTFHYAYDSSSHLRSASDAAGDTVSYTYRDDLLTGIVKPDGSSREYHYVLLDSRWVVDWTSDEEGNKEVFRYDPQARFTEYENASGVTEREYYDERNRTTRVLHSDGSFTQFEYDENDNLTRRVDELGRASSFTYDERRNVSSAVDAGGNSERWTYNGFNEVTTYTDRAGDLTTFDHDANGNLIRIGYPDGSATVYRYDSMGELSSKTDQRGNTTRYGYDGYGNLASPTTPLGEQTQYARDAIGNILSATDAAGNTRLFEYNRDNNLIKVTDSRGSTRRYEYSNRKDLVKTIDPLGNQTAFSYDRRHLLVKVTNALGETLEYGYRGDGTLTDKTVDARSHTRYEYDGRGNLVKSTQVETGATTAYSWDAGRQRTGQIDPIGNNTTYGYDSLGRITTVKDPAENTEIFEYDYNGNLVAVTDKLGNRTRMSYDRMNRLSTRTDAEQNTRSFAYDEAGNLQALTDENGAPTYYRYDADGRLSTVIDALGNTVGYTYTPTGLVRNRTDQNGMATEYAYNGNGQVASIADPLGGTRTFDYDAADNLVSITDPNGNITKQQFDALGRLIERTDPVGNATGFLYNYLGKLSAVVDALGNTKKYNYDAAGRLLQVINELGKARSYTYNLAGKVTALVDELGRRTSYDYDSLNALKSVTDPLGAVTQYQRDAMGNLSRVTYPNNSTYGYRYDALGRMIAETNQIGKTQSFVYDPVGDLVKQVDFAGHQTAFQYDALWRLVETDYFDGTEKTFRYDGVGNPLHAENAAGSLDFSYDADGRLVQSRDSSTSQTLAYRYDAAGNRIGLTWQEQSRTTSYSYGKNNELLSLTDPQGGKTEFGYDPLGREVSRTLPNGIETHLSYDAAGRLMALKNVRTSGTGYRVNDEGELKSEAYLYNDAGERTYTVSTGGRITAYVYDAAGRLAGVSYPFANGKIEADLEERIALGLLPEDQQKGDNGTQREWESVTRNMLPSTHDNNEFDLGGLKADLGQMLKMLTGHGRIVIGAGATEFASRLQVDSETANQLYQAYGLLEDSNDGRRNSLDTRQWMWNESFSYDTQGNRLSKANGWGVVPYVYDAANEMLQAGAKRYGYDENGNLAQESLGEAKARYHYTPDNRLAQVDTDLMDALLFGSEEQAGIPTVDWNNTSWSGTRQVKYDYDALGRRSSRVALSRITEEGKNPKSWQHQLTQEYLYDAQSFLMLSELDVGAVDEHDARFDNTMGAASFDSIVEYVWANERPAQRGDIDRGLSHRDDTLYYTQDILGSTMQLSDAQGMVQSTYAYDAFGVSLRGDLGGTNVYGYTGKRYDPMTGMYDYGFREYRPQLGRWTTLDAIRAGKNWYVYVNNDPIDFVDPVGLEPNDGYRGFAPFGANSGLLSINNVNTGSELLDYVLSEPAGVANVLTWPASLAIESFAYVDATVGNPVSQSLFGMSSTELYTVTGQAELIYAKELQLAAQSARYLEALSAAGGGAGASESMFASATSLFRNGPLTNAGRALTKHPNVIGESGNLLQKLGSARGVNEAAAKALADIMENGAVTTKATKAFGQVIEYKLPSGIGARFEASTSEFIGFLGRGL